MPVSPKDIQPQVEARRRVFEGKVASLEASIDYTIREQAPFSGEEVRYKLTVAFPKEVVARVIRDYQAQGWEVSRERGSEEDPDELIFRYLEKKFL